MSALPLASLPPRALQALHDHLEAIDAEVRFGILTPIQRAGTVLAWAQFHRIDTATITPKSLAVAIQAQQAVFDSGDPMPSDYLQLVFVIAAHARALA